MFGFLRSCSFEGVSLNFLFFFFSRLLSFILLIAMSFPFISASCSELEPDPEDSRQDLKSNSESLISDKLEKSPWAFVVRPRISALREFGGGDLPFREMLCLLTSSSLLQNSELAGKEVLNSSEGLGGRGFLVDSSSVSLEEFAEGLSGRGSLLH